MVLCADRTDGAVHLDVEVVDCEAEVFKERRREHDAAGPCVGRFRLQGGAAVDLLLTLAGRAGKDRAPLCRSEPSVGAEGARCEQRRRWWRVGRAVVGAGILAAEEDDRLWREQLRRVRRAHRLGEPATKTEVVDRLPFGTVLERRGRADIAVGRITERTIDRQIFRKGLVLYQRHARLDVVLGHVELTSLRRARAAETTQITGRQLAVGLIPQSFLAIFGAERDCCRRLRPARLYAPLAEISDEVAAHHFFLGLADGDAICRHVSQHGGRERTGCRGEDIDRNAGRIALVDDRFTSRHAGDIHHLQRVLQALARPVAGLIVRIGGQAVLGKDVVAPRVVEIALDAKDDAILSVAQIVDAIAAFHCTTTNEDGRVRVGIGRTEERARRPLTTGAPVGQMKACSEAESSGLSQLIRNGVQRHRPVRPARSCGRP